ncbi:MAG: thiamine phosphate synthase [Candidatus Omnitrophota bacterium]
MGSKKQLLKNWKTYAILDDGFFPDRQTLLKKFHELLGSPVDAVQLRFENFADRSLYRAAERMVSSAEKTGIPVIINDRPEVALSLGAQGAHLGKSDISVAIARKMLGRKAIIGKTVRNHADIMRSQAEGADYVSIGPFFRTPLKPRFKTVPASLGRAFFGNIKIPLVAVGGINKNNAGKVAARGAKTVAFLRYGTTEKNTAKRIEELRCMMTTKEKP